MSVPGDAQQAAAKLAAGLRGAADPARARLFVYGVCLAIAFALYLFVHGWGRGGMFWLAAAATVAGLVLGTLLNDRTLSPRILRYATVLAVGLAIAVPLGPSAVRANSIAAALSATTVWPQMLVALFGSRVLAELAELQFIDQWRDPFAVDRGVPVQSIAAALVLGAFFTLLFYQAGAYFGGRQWSVAGTVLGALFGDSVIHHVIVFLFFAILAFIIDAALLFIRDRSAVRAIRAIAQARDGMGRAELRRLLAEELAPWAHTRTVRLIRDSLDAAAARGATFPAASAALSGYHQASRRFVRGLIPFLPLLGFLGTVIGLTIALAQLPHGLGAGQRESFDIGASLAGLAVQFETTLLGLIGSIIASLALGLLEKAETELAAECALLVDAAEARDRPHAP